MLQVRKNEISLRQWPGGSALLRTLDGTLIAKYALCWQQCSFSHSIEVRGLAISSLSLHIPAKMSAFNSHTQQNATVAT